jgi:hypothetical protein
VIHATPLGVTDVDDVSKGSLPPVQNFEMCSNLPPGEKIIEAAHHKATDEYRIVPMVKNGWLLGGYSRVCDTARHAVA